MISVTEAQAGSRQVPMVILVALLAALLAASTLVVACSDPSDERPVAPTGEPSITGVITSTAGVRNGDIVGSFLIEEGSGAYDKASVTVTVKTGWFRRGGDGFAAIDRPTGQELAGKVVEVRFTGPVAESYPVQATAGWVIVRD